MKERVGLLYNPISGKGRAQEIAADISVVLIAARYDTEVFQSRPVYAAGELESRLMGLSALIVCGGDGTLMPLLDALAATQVPVYMAPGGNESLFARAFGMRATAEYVAEALKSRNVSSHHYGYVNNRAFFSMVSVGLDSAVIARIASRRRSAIGHAGYVLPTLTALLKFHVPRISAISDGEPFVTERSGYLNAANAACYARGLNPVADADSTCGAITARFYPHRTRLWYLRWLWPLLRGVPLNPKSSARCVAKELRLETLDAPFPVQADGEYVGETPVSVRSSQSTVRVLHPPTSSLRNASMIP